MNTTRLMNAAEAALRKMKESGIGQGETELRAAVDEAKEAPMIIVINADTTPTLVDMNGHEIPNVLVIDWSVTQRTNDCPVCGREQTEGISCDHCGLYLWDEKDLEKRARTAAIVLWRKGQKGPR